MSIRANPGSPLNSGQRNPFRLSHEVCWLLLLGAIATLASFGSFRRPAVTVSGLTLGLTRTEVLGIKGLPSFSEGSPHPYQLEYWNESPPLSITLDSHDRVIRLEGGSPEIDSQNIRTWGIQDVKRALGPPLSVSYGQTFLGQEGKESTQTYLRYPDLHLLVSAQSGSPIAFCLFLTPPAPHL